MTAIKGDHVLVVNGKLYPTVFRSLGTAKAMRTSRYRGKGTIYSVVIDGWVPRLYMVDRAE